MCSARSLGSSEEVSDRARIALLLPSVRFAGVGGVVVNTLTIYAEGPGSIQGRKQSRPVTKL